MNRITVIDIQHKTFKRKLQGYDPADVDQFLDEIIETLEDEAQHRAALEAEVADMRERISHFKAMEESLQHTLLLAQRTADEVKASAHKEADLIRAEARLSIEKEIASYTERATDARRESQRAIETAEKAKSELRSLLMTHLALIDRGDGPAAGAPREPAARDSTPRDEPAGREETALGASAAPAFVVPKGPPSELPFASVPASANGSPAATPVER